MPSVPRFSISQNDEFVLVSIKVPFIRVTSAEIVTDGHDFSFYCSPYLLKLCFPGEFAEEDERCKAVYDPYIDNGTLVAHLPKKVPGEYFPDLDLTTKLLQVRRQKDVEDAIQEGSIEVLDSVEFDNENADEETQLSKVDSSGLQIRKPIISYGFNQSYSKVLVNLRDELVDMLEIKEPETIPVSHRRSLRLQSENMRFDIERYLGDFFEAESDPLYGEAMSYKPFWINQWDISKDLDKESKQQKIEGNTVKVNNKEKAFELIGGFTEAERETLSNSLKHKEYLIASNSPEERSLFLVLTDILFSYCYDVRMTQGEERNVESAANIARLSSVLSWLDPMNSPLDNVSSVIKCCLRRSIVLPYLRVWKLSRKVLTDVTKILFLGKRTILKCLLHIRQLMEHTDTHYLLNKLYLDDFCVWIQSDSVTDEVIISFAKEYNNAKTAIETAPQQGKEYMGFHLPELEQWAVKYQQGEVEEEGENSDSESESEEDDSDSESESENEDSNKEIKEKDVKEDEKSQDDVQDSILYSVPKKLLIYDGQHLNGLELAYLETTLPEVTTEAVVDQKTEAVNKLLDIRERPVTSIMVGEGNPVDEPKVKKILIEEISSTENQETHEEEQLSKSSVQQINSQLSQLSVNESV